MVFSISLKNKGLTQKTQKYLLASYIFIALFSCQRTDYIVVYDFYEGWRTELEVLIRPVYLKQDCSEELKTSVAVHRGEHLM